MANNKYRTPERNEVVISMWTTEAAVSEIKRRLDALPGRAVPTWAIAPWANSLGVKRPAGYSLKISQAASAKAASVLARATPERDALLTELWTAGTFIPAIASALNCLPGHHLTGRFVERRARKLKLKRPPEYLAHVRRVAAGRIPNAAKWPIVLTPRIEAPGPVVPSPAPVVMKERKTFPVVRRFSMLGGRI
jgi:hypothetical protein